MVRCVQRLVGVLAWIVLWGCAHEEAKKYHDPSLKTPEAFYEQKLTTAPAELPKPRRKKVKQAPAPFPKSFLAPVSLTTNEAVPLKDVFLALAQQANVNMVISPDIKGTTIIHAQKRPLMDLVTDICQSYGLRYHLDRDILKVEVDTPFLKTYDLAFLILQRSNHNRFSVATDVFTARDEASASDEDNGSNTLLTAESKTDFWEELKENLEMILAESSYDTKPGRYTLHKQGGLISVHATDQQHKMIEQYLKDLKQSVSQQVLIEAKIVEVNLKDEYKSGINWEAVKNDFFLQSTLGAVATSAGNPQSGSLSGPSQRNIFTVGGHGSDVTGLISFLGKFGTVRTLSNPRLTVLNNQSAVLKVATNKVYFKLNYSKEYNFYDKHEQVYVSSDAKTVPIGLVMVVHPSIKRDDGRIIMTLRPTISRVIQEIADPAVGIASHQQQTSFVPEVQVRELDSVLAMQSGETVVVGGLMEERADNESTGLPDFRHIPILSDATNSKSNDRTITELVIFLRAVVIDQSEDEEGVSDTVTSADIQTYRLFSKDPRPLQFGAPSARTTP